MTKDQLINHHSLMHGIIVASEPLLKKAMEKAEGALWAYYARHLEEEKGHVAMLRADLTRLGVKDIARFHAAAQLAGSQYYLLEHDHPAIFLGYMHMLESRAPTIEMVMELERAFDVELTCMQHHAVHDPDHVIELVKMIAKQPDDIQRLIAWNEQNCAALLADTFASMGG